MKWWAKNYIAQLKDELIKKVKQQSFLVEKSRRVWRNFKKYISNFGGVDLLESVEEKAANLFYYIIKGHPFNDGNKKNRCFMFILFE